MSTKNLEARLGRLEEAQGERELPNGGMLLIFLGDEETERDAIERALSLPPVAGLTPAQRRRLIPIVLSPADANA